MKPRHKRQRPRSTSGISRGELAGDPALRRHRRRFAMGAGLYLLLFLFVGLFAEFGLRDHDSRAAAALVVLILGSSGLLLAFHSGGARLLDVWRGRR